MQHALQHTEVGPISAVEAARGERRPSAEHDAPVGALPEIEDEPAAVVGGVAGGQNREREIRRQLGRRDLEAVDGEQRAREARHEAVRVAVRRDDDVARGQSSAGCDDAPALARPLECGGGGELVDPGSGRHGRPAKIARQIERLHRGATRIHQAAEVARRSDKALRLCPVQHPRADPAIDEVLTGRLRCVERQGRMAEPQHTGRGPMAFEALSLDEVAQEPSRLFAEPEKAAASLAEPLDESRARRV